MRDLGILGVLAAAVSQPGASPIRPELVVIHHTDCGMFRLANPAIQGQVAKRLGLSVDEVSAMAISDPTTSVRDDVDRLRYTPRNARRTDRLRLRLRREQREDQPSCATGPTPRLLNPRLNQDGGVGKIAVCVGVDMSAAGIGSPASARDCSSYEGTVAVRTVPTPQRSARRGRRGGRGGEPDPIEGKDIIGGRWKNGEVLEQLDASDGIIFGSPTYMGSVSGQMESFLDATAERWLAQSWKDKVARAFSVSGDPAETSSTSLCASRPGHAAGYDLRGSGDASECRGAQSIKFLFRRCSSGDATTPR